MSAAARTAQVFGWFASVLVVAMLWSFFLLPDSSNPNDRDAEDWLLLPLMLGAVGMAAGVCAASAGLACLVRRERVGVPVAVPLAAGTALSMLVVLWLLAVLR